MTALSIMSGIVVFVLSFYGLGALLPRRSPKRRIGYSGRWSAVEELASTVFSSFVIAVIVVWALKGLGFIQVVGLRGISWGAYVVEGGQTANAIITLSLSIVFVVGFVVRAAFMAPEATRQAARSLAKSDWLDEFIEWCVARRNATIEGARWLLERVRRLLFLFEW